MYAVKSKFFNAAGINCWINKLTEFFVFQEVLSDEDKMDSVKVSSPEDIVKSPAYKDENSPSSEKHDESKSDFGDDIGKYLFYQIVFGKKISFEQNEFFLNVDK